MRLAAVVHHVLQLGHGVVLQRLELGQVEVPRDAGLLGQSADLFLETFRRMPTANAEGPHRTEGWRRKGLG